MMNYLPTTDRIPPGFGGGNQRLFRFEGSSHGASVVCHWGSYGGDLGLFELAVIHYKDDTEWDICYCTPITEDVLGHLTEEQVQETLAQLDALGQRDCQCPTQEERLANLRKSMDALGTNLSEPS